MLLQTPSVDLTAGGLLMPGISWVCTFSAINFDGNFLFSSPDSDESKNQSKVSDTADDENT